MIPNTQESGLQLYKRPQDLDPVPCPTTRPAIQLPVLSTPTANTVD